MADIKRFILYLMCLLLTTESKFNGNLALAGNDNSIRERRVMRGADDDDFNKTQQDMNDIANDLKNFVANAETGVAVGLKVLDLINGKGDTFQILNSISKLAPNFGPAFAAISSVFSVINLFIMDSKSDSAELVAMKEAFKKMHLRFDQVDQGLNNIKGMLAKMLDLIEKLEAQNKVIEFENKHVEFRQMLKNLNIAYRNWLDKSTSVNFEIFDAKCKGLLDGDELWTKLQGMIIRDSVDNVTMTEVIQSQYWLRKLEYWSKTLLFDALAVITISQSCIGLRGHHKSFKIGKAERRGQQLKNITVKLMEIQTKYNDGWKDEIKREITKVQGEKLCEPVTHESWNVWANKYKSHLENKYNSISFNLTWLVVAFPCPKERCYIKGIYLTHSQLIRVAKCPKEYCFDVDFATSTCRVKIIVVYANDSVPISQATKDAAVTAVNEDGRLSVPDYVFGATNICENNGAYLRTDYVYQEPYFMNLCRYGLGKAIIEKTRFSVFFQEHFVERGGDNAKELVHAYTAPGTSFYAGRFIAYRLTWNVTQQEKCWNKKNESKIYFVPISVIFAF